MTGSKKMKSMIPLLFIILQLIESTVGNCQLIATARTIEAEEKPGNSQEQIHQTQLQLLCRNVNCSVSNFTCDTYNEFNISRDCTGDDCSRLFHLYENRCIDESQGQPTAPTAPTEPPSDPMSSKSQVSPIRMPMNVRPRYTSCKRATITVIVTKYSDNTASTMVSQSSCNTNSIILPTTTVLQETQTTVTHVITPATWTTCQCNTTELVATTMTRGPEPPNNKFCTPIISTKFVATTVLSPPQSCASELSQFTTIPKFKSPIASLALKPCTCSNTGVPAQGTGTSNATTALGALLGLSLVLLALVTVGWVWTCWTMRKRGRFTINSKQNNFPNTPGTVTINNNMDTLKRLRNPLYEETTTNGLLPLSEAELQTGQGESEQTGPTYEIIPLADPVNMKTSKKNGNARLEKQETPTAGGRVSAGMASSKNDNKTQSVGEGSVNHYYLPDEKAKGESSRRTGERDRNNNYHLLGNAEEEREEVVRENVYHVLENPLDSYDEDYADPDVEETNNIYHVLEGPTPEGEEEKEGQTEAEREEVEREKVEREEERDREKLERGEPLTEPTAYEVPITSGSKHNSIVRE